ATHAGVHLGQQRGGHLHKGHAAHVAGGGKTGHVANHAAAQGVQHRLAVSGFFQQLGENLVQRRPVLVLLAIGQFHIQHGLVVRRNRGAQGGGVERAHRGVGDDQGFGRLGQPRKRGRVLQQAFADQDVVAAVTQVNGDRGGAGRRGGGGREGSRCHERRGSQVETR